MSLLVPVSVGELLDKLTILDIKAERISEPEKLANVQRERRALEQAWLESPHAEADVAAARAALKAVNEQLWEIEEAIRDKERAGCFDAGFVALARSVYATNDRRAALKRQVNLQVGSTLVEEKSYPDYDRPSP